MSDPLFFEMIKPAESMKSVAIKDPDFQVSSAQGLRLMVEKGFEEAVSDFLIAEISSSPNNLKNHLHRICLQYDRNDSTLLFAALLDLWLALDGSGRKLFRRMLLGAEKVLERSQFEWLASLYTSKKVWHGETPEWFGSVLDTGVYGRLGLVDVLAESGSVIKRDPLQEAHECLEYSQIEQAQQILESALLEEPLREPLHIDLLNIYKSTHDLAALNKMKAKLTCCSGSILGQWDALAEQLSKELAQ